jgi:hypothetical protein
MGCSGIKEIPPEISKLLLSLDEKIIEFNKTFIEEAEKVKKEFEKEIKSRHDKLEEYKKSKEGITEERIKDLNKKELEKEIDILSNEVDKMHYIFDLGLELVEPIRIIVLNELLEKAKSAASISLAAINKQIEKIKNYSIIDFLNSTYGKVLKDALVKKGLSESLLKGIKKEIMKNREERRKTERKEFGIKVNEFENENIKELKLNLMELIESEYKSIDQNFKGYVRDKIMDNMISVK